MIRWEEVRLPTEWANVRKHYIEETNQIVIVGWKTDDEDEKGEILASINVDTKELEYFDVNAQYDGIAQATVILALHSIENNYYK